MTAATMVALSSKLYRGRRVRVGHCRVWVEQFGVARDLDARFDLRSHSPDGYEWGYRGSGPAQLALALVADALGDDERAVAIYQAFKEREVATWGDEWSISGEAIVAAVDALEANHRRNQQ